MSQWSWYLDDIFFGVCVCVFGPFSWRHKKSNECICIQKLASSRIIKVIQIKKSKVHRFFCHFWVRVLEHQTISNLPWSNSVFLWKSMTMHLPAMDRKYKFIQILLTNRISFCQFSHQSELLYSQQSLLHHGPKIKHVNKSEIHVR